METCKCGNKIKKTSEYCRKCYNEVYGLESKTKGDLIDSRKNWWEARIPIAKHARKVFKLSNKNKCCGNCGYDKNYQVCHIKPVSDFLDTATLKEINDLNNLIALCPNCHWEFDNGLLKL